MSFPLCDSADVGTVNAEAAGDAAVHAAERLNVVFDLLKLDALTFSFHGITTMPFSGPLQLQRELYGRHQAGQIDLACFFVEPADRRSKCNENPDCR